SSGIEVWILDFGFWISIRSKIRNPKSKMRGEKKVRRYRSTRRLGYALALIALVAPRLLQAQTTNFTAVSGSWYDPPNWDAGSPASTNNAVINNGGTALISDPNQTAVGS